MGEIYRLDFPNGKSYIGATTKTAIIRFRSHKRNAQIGKGCAAGIYGAWRKFGEPKLVVLARIERDALAAAEIKAICEFKTLSPHGYNLRKGGDSDWLIKGKVNAARSCKNEEKDCAAIIAKWSVEAIERLTNY